MAWVHSSIAIEIDILQSTFTTLLHNIQKLTHVDTTQKPIKRQTKFTNVKNKENNKLRLANLSKSIEKKLRYSSGALKIF